LNHLLSNSLKFTKQGNITVRLRYEIEDIKELCIIEVFDIGIGMTEKQQSVIFQRFAQASDSIARMFGGLVWVFLLFRILHYFWVAM
jgi:signal transduction histidine kinase